MYCVYVYICIYYILNVIYISAKKESMEEDMSHHLSVHNGAF
jgi:hypothetical protein